MDISLDLDDDLLADFERAAKLNGRSLEAELRDALRAGRPRRRLSPAERVALSDRVRAPTPASAAAVDSTDLIRESRDAR